MNAREYGRRLRPGHPYALVTPLVPFPIAKMVGFFHWWIWNYRATLTVWAVIALPLTAVLGVCAALRS